jgi:hypothetical protein
VGPQEGSGRKLELKVRKIWLVFGERKLLQGQCPGVLNMNFTLSTTVLRSGTAHADLEAWDYVREGILNDDNKLKGDCEPVYCCYNPDCGKCSSEVFEKYPNFRCVEWTPRYGFEEASGANKFGLKLGLLFAVVFVAFSL